MNRVATIPHPSLRISRRPLAEAAWSLAALAVAAVVGWMGGHSVLPLVGAIGALTATLFPVQTIYLGVAWIALSRVGAELVHVTVGGVTLTEVDALVGLVALAGIRIRMARPGRDPRFTVLTPFFAWPVFLLARSLVPASDATLHASPLVDLRYLEAWLVIPALFEVIRRRRDPVHDGIRYLCGLAYLACIAALATWALHRAGFVAVGQYPWAQVSGSAAGDVRPGGEILIPVVGALLWHGRAWWPFESRAFAWALVAGEVLVSQTLSLVVAIVAGIVVSVVFVSRSSSAATKAATILAVIGFVLVATGSVGAESRFDLSRRTGEDSAQYRVEELRTIQEVVLSDPYTTAIGAGAGSLVNFQAKLVGEVKRDAHNVYADVVLKSGFVGLVVFLAPFLALFRRVRRRGGGLAAGLCGAIAAVAVLSLTVPFAWTVQGFAGLATVIVVSVFALGAETGRSTK